jgi:UDP-2-acetamido-3-amino-2,3-dideoxy-glucuronate N-acetyltransferase
MMTDTLNDVQGITFPEKVELSNGTVFYNLENSQIHPEVFMGRDCSIHSHVWIGRGVIIGDCVKIQAFTFIPEGVTIGDNVFLGPRTTFTNDKYPPSHGKKWSKTMVEQGASIGAGAIILPGITIGAHSTVGAGAVVTKDVASGVTVVGNPACLVE